MFRLRVYLSHFSWQALRLAFRQTCQTLHQGTASASRQTAMKISCFDLAEMKTTSTTKANQLDGGTAQPGRARSFASAPACSLSQVVPVVSNHMEDHGTLMIASGGATRARRRSTGRLAWRRPRWDGVRRRQGTPRQFQRRRRRRRASRPPLSPRCGWPR